MASIPNNFKPDLIVIETTISNANLAIDSSFDFYLIYEFFYYQFLNSNIDEKRMPSLLSNKTIYGAP